MPTRYNGKYYGNNAYGRRMLAKAKARRKTAARKPKRNQKFQRGLRTIQPITRRINNVTHLHEYQNNGKIDMPSWATFRANTPASQATDVCLVQSFSLSNVQVFKNDGYSFSGTGNNHTSGVYMAYSKTVDDAYTVAGGATMMPGYASAPYAKDQFNHYQILGTEFEIKLRVVNGRVDPDGNTIPIKILLIPVSDSSTVTSTSTTEELELLPYVQSRILTGEMNNPNKTCVMKYKHSPRKWNGINKGNYLTDSRYICNATANQGTAENGGNQPIEQETLKLVICPLNKHFSNGLAESLEPPVIYFSLKMKKWIRYTDPNLENISNL